MDTQKQFQWNSSFEHPKHKKIFTILLSKILFIWTYALRMLHVPQLNPLGFWIADGKAHRLKPLLLLDFSCKKLDYALLSLKMYEYWYFCMCIDVWFFSKELQELLPLKDFQIYTMGVKRDTDTNLSSFSTFVIFLSIMYVSLYFSTNLAEWSKNHQEINEEVKHFATL